MKTKTFKSEYIMGIKVKVTELKTGFKLEYGNGYIYREEKNKVKLYNHLWNNMSHYYADKIVNYFFGESHF